MVTTQVILLSLYLLCALLLTIFTSSAFVHLLLYAWRGQDPEPVPPLADWPKVTVQLPIYNERFVVERLLNAVAALDYPRDRLTIQLLDDSTDTTSRIAANRIRALRRAGVDVRHIRRPKRTGYKAGALAYGLTRTDAPFVAVFDADFVPPPDFLRRTVPFLVVDPGLALVQGRWGHLNPFANLLTLGQTLSIDAHFVIEQTARSRAGLLLTFNGTGGVWRTAAIEDAGGWQDTTLTEDLDLSYRAQMAGWRLKCLPDVVVPGELPAHMNAYRQQQARWAQGNTQVFKLALPHLWRTPGLSIAQRFMGTLHLSQYLPQVWLLLMVLLVPPLILTGDLLERVPLWPLGVVGLIPPVFYVVSQRTLYPDWWRRLLAFPVLLALGTGLTLSNSLAVLSALFGNARRAEFRRTPKLGEAAVVMAGDMLRNMGRNYGELAMAAYALWGAWLAWGRAPEFVPYMAVNAASFLAVALWGAFDQWHLGRGAAVPNPTRQRAS